MASIPVQARGVCGVAQTKDVRLIPLRLGDSTVLIEMFILNNDVPPLLSVTLLDNCIIDFKSNLITWNWPNKAPCKSTMCTLRSKHRSVNASQRVRISNSLYHMCKLLRAHGGCLGVKCR